MVAYMRNDGYIDLTPDYPYEIDKLMANGYIKLKQSPRKYRACCFDIYHKGEKITFSKAYNIYKVQSALKKVGFK